MLPDPSYEPHNDALDRILLIMGVPGGAALLFLAWWMWPNSIEQEPLFVLASIVVAIAGALLIWNVLTCLLAHIATSRFLPRLLASGIAAIIRCIGSPAARQILARHSATAALAVALVGGGHSALASPLSQAPPSSPHLDHTQSAPSRIYEDAPIPDNLQWPLPPTEGSPSAPAQPSMPAAPSPGAEPNPLDIPPSPSSSNEGGARADNSAPAVEDPVPTAPTESSSPHLPTHAPDTAAPEGSKPTPPPSGAAPPALQVEDLQPQEPNPLEVPARDTPTPAAENPHLQTPTENSPAPPSRHVDITDPAVTLPGEPDPTRFPTPAESSQSAQTGAAPAPTENGVTWVRESFDSVVDMLSAPEDSAPTSPEAKHSSASPQAGRTQPEAPEENPAPTAASSGTHTVVDGDSLWAISRQALGPQASEAEIADAWPRIYEENREVIGDSPDLIHPGDILNLPKELT